MNTQRWMSSQFFIFYMTWGIFLPYWTGWMINIKGISISQASLIMSLGLVIRGLATLTAFPYFSGKFSSKTMLNGMAIGTVLAILLNIPAGTFATLLAATLVLNFFYPTLMPALEGVAGILAQSKQLQHYGRSRSWGSFGFIIAGIALTFITGALGDEVILWALLLGTLVFAGLGFMRAPAVLSEKPQANQVKKGGMLQLFRIRHFTLVLVIVILLQASHASYYSFAFIFLQDIHAPKYSIGVILNIAVVAEIIFFSIADRRFKHLSEGALLAVAALGATVRWLLIFAFPNVVVFCIAQALHSFSFAMGHYAFMKYMIKHIPHSQISDAQGVYAALALSWITAVFTAFGGFLYEIEPRYGFGGMIVCTVPSMLLALYYRKLADKKAPAAA